MSNFTPIAYPYPVLKIFCKKVTENAVLLNSHYATFFYSKRLLLRNFCCLIRNLRTYVCCYVVYSYASRPDSSFPRIIHSRRIGESVSRYPSNRGEGGSFFKLCLDWLGGKKMGGPAAAFNDIHWGSGFVFRLARREKDRRVFFRFARPDGGKR